MAISFSVKIFQQDVFLLALYFKPVGSSYQYCIVYVQKVDNSNCKLMHELCLNHIWTLHIIICTCIEPTKVCQKITCECLKTGKN